MRPSSKRHEECEQQRESTTSRWLRPLAIVGLVAVLVAAPVAAVTGAGSGGGGPAAADGGSAPAQERTPTMTEAAGSSAGHSGSGSSSSVTAVAGSEFDHRDDEAELEPDPREIELGQSVRAEIDEDDPQSEEYRGYHDPISFDGEEGQAVSIQMNAFSRYGPHPVYEGPRGPSQDSEESQMADPYLLLVGPDGDVIARSDDTGRSLNAAIQGIVLPDDGEYTIVATSYGDEQTFEYRLETSVEQQGETGLDLRSIDLNSTATGEIDKADPYERARRGFYEPVTFEGDSGQTVRIDMGSRPGDTYLMLLDPSGNVIAENDDHEGLNSSIERVTLPEDGEYTIVATSFSEEDRFIYELSVTVIGTGDPGASGTDLRDISIGQTASGQIDTGDPNARFLRGYYEPVTFEARGGQSVTIDMESRGGDSYLMLYGPEGDRIASNDDYEGLDSHIEAELPETGEYTIIATSFGEEDTFSYDLTLSEGGSGGVDENATDLRSIQYGETADGTIDEGDPQSRVYRGWYEPVTFNGSAGDEISVDMTSEDDTYLILLAPNGTVIAENDDYRGLDSHVEAELEVDGQYTIIATSFDARATFDYELTLERTDTAQS
jgi:predicted  nucleic acid-binding Zn-ribbon protein